MISLMRKDSLQLFWIFFHVVLGFLSVQEKWFLIGWFGILVVSLVLTFFTKSNLQHMIIFFMGYSLAIEVLARGVQASPYIPDQLGKYLGVVMFSLGLALGGPIKKVSFYGAMLLLLSLPGLAIAPEYSRAQIVFNYFGPLALYLGVIFCSRQIMTFEEFKQLCRIIIYPIISLACFAIFKAAQFEKIDYGLTANFESSGGSITNQVATLFGAAICILSLMYLTNQRLFRFKWIDVGLILLFSIRGLLTFSRGGMVSAALAIIAVILFPKAKAAWQDSEIRMRNIKPATLMLALFLLVGAFFAVNLYTDNFLLYRYQGKTQRSLQTGFDNTVTIDQISTGRYHIFQSDINMFLANPALGVGVGWSAIVRHQYGGSEGHAAHLEFSRLLAEHGLPGLVLVILLYIYPFYLVLREPNNYRRSIMLIMLIMALTATFHSAMRTMITPFLFSIAFISFVPTNYDWKKQLEEVAASRKRLKNRRANKPEPAIQATV
jgi:O-antigen ligase